MADVSQLADGLMYYVVFLFSTTLHEAAHAWAAQRGGDLTAYRGGQVSLDPMPHIRREPIGMVALPLPRRAAWMALAGPAANLLLVVLAALALRVGAMAGVFVPPASVDFGML